MHLQIRPAIRDDVLAIDALMIDNFGYIYCNVFDTSVRLTKKLFRKLLLARRGRHALGYRSFMVATVIDEPQEEYVVGLLHLSNPLFQTRSATLRSLTASMFIVLRLVGVRGVIRTISNLRSFGDLSSRPTKDELHINYIAVAEPYRQHGVGAALMRYAKDAAQVQRKSLVSLDARETNARGQRFFEASGFLPAAMIASKADAIFGQGARIRMVYKTPGVEQSVLAASQTQ